MNLNNKKPTLMPLKDKEYLIIQPDEPKLFQYKPKTTKELQVGISWKEILLGFKYKSKEKNKLHTFRKPTSEDLENLSFTITVTSGVATTKDDFEIYSEE